MYKEYLHTLVLLLHCTFKLIVHLFQNITWSCFLQVGETPIFWSKVGETGVGKMGVGKQGISHCE